MTIVVTITVTVEAVAAEDGLLPTVPATVGTGLDDGNEVGDCTVSVRVTVVVGGVLPRV